MACSKYELGYEENRFEIVVSQRFHCPICFLVLKDPVMCKNEHYYCSSCIKTYLENFSFCPTCREPLTVDTLKPAPRIVKDYISELNIHCDFHPRGCPEIVQVGHLKRHVASCGFSPVQCSNGGCNVLLNARDKLHHEAEVCDFRKLKCHDCGQLKNEVKEMKDEMITGQNKVKNEVKEQIKGMEEEVKGVKGEIKNELKVIVRQVLVSQDQMQSKIVNEIKKEVKEQIKNEVKNEVRDMKEEIKNEMKGMIENEMKGMKGEIKGEVNQIKDDIKNEMKEIVTNAVRDAIAGIKYPEFERKSSNQRSQATCSLDVRGKIFVVGGKQKITKKVTTKNKSTECFNWADKTWTLVDSAVFEGRLHMCSFLYEGQMVVAGGVDDGGNKTHTIKCLNVTDPTATWRDFHVNLPVRCDRHKVVNRDDQLFISGGWVQDVERYTHAVPFFGTFRSTGLVQAIDETGSRRSDVVYEVQLVPPYSSKILTRLPQPRFSHAMEMFDHKLFILGGHDESKIISSVVQYDLIKNECKQMPPLPYAVREMATVLWRNNVLVIGGKDDDYNPLDKVVLYDVITGRSQMLPCMKQKRSGCAAVLTGNVVVVMGGRDEKDKYLKSVECFDFERQVWQDLPDMLEPRAYATAVVNPNH